MKKLIQWFNNNSRGSAEIIAFILILPLLLFPLLEGVRVFSDLHRFDILKQATRATLLQMESKGGLTETDYNNLVSFLVEKGFDRNDITIDYTPYPVNYGEDVIVRISYNYPRTKYKLTLTGLEKAKETGVMVSGPLKSTSKHYHR